MSQFYARPPKRDVSGSCFGSLAPAAGRVVGAAAGHDLVVTLDQQPARRVAVADRGVDRAPRAEGGVESPVGEIAADVLCASRVADYHQLPVRLHGGVVEPVVGPGVGGGQLPGAVEARIRLPGRVAAADAAFEDLPVGLDGGVVGLVVGAGVEIELGDPAGAEAGVQRAGAVAV